MTMKQEKTKRVGALENAKAGDYLKWTTGIGDLQVRRIVRTTATQVIAESSAGQDTRFYRSGRRVCGVGKSAVIATSDEWQQYQELQRMAQERARERLKRALLNITDPYWQATLILLNKTDPEIAAILRATISEDDAKRIADCRIRPSP